MDMMEKIKLLQIEYNYNIVEEKLPTVGKTPSITLEEFKELMEKRQRIILEIERLELQKLQKLEEDVDEEVALRLHKKFQSGQEIK